MSSSMSGQCMPEPLPMISNRERCSGVASDRRHDHAKGTVIVRPSSNCAEITSSETETLWIRGSTFGAVLTPSLQDLLDVTNHLSTNLIQLPRGETIVPSQRHRDKPVLADSVLTLNVHVFRFVAVEAVKEEPIA